jgi:hypothetical protein
MSTPFLVGFAQGVVTTLLAEKLIDIARDGEVRTVMFVANYLGTTGQGTSLLSSLEKALLLCPEVDELYADLDTLKVIVEGLKHR